MQQQTALAPDAGAGWLGWAVVEMARRTRSDTAGDGDAGGYALRGAELRAARLEVRLSQRELATRLAYSPSSVCGWEHDRHRVPESVWELILAELERERARWGGRRRRLQA